MIPVDPDDRSALAGEHVLGLLSEAESAAVEAAMAHDDALADDVRYWENRLAPLCGLARSEAPDPALWARIERDLGLAARPARAGASEGWTTQLWNALGFWRMAAAALAVVALVVGGMLATRDGGRGDRAYVAVLQAADQSPGWLVEIGRDRAVRLTAVKATDPGPGRALQLWTLIDRAQGPISLGLVPPTARDFLAAPTPGIGADQLFEISLEPATGSPTGRPTGPVLFIGRTVAAR
ncbi:MAG: anti-sigma factor [Rhodospirillales bacterium]|nr:anti-sigma factor [Rhodospirillales bacterium]